MDAVVNKSISPYTLPKDVHALLPGPRKYVTLYGQRNFVDVINLRILRREDCPGLRRRVKSNFKNPYKGGRNMGDKE